MSLLLISCLLLNCSERNIRKPNYHLDDATRGLLHCSRLLDRALDAARIDAAYGDLASFSGRDPSDSLRNVRDLGVASEVTLRGVKLLRGVAYTRGEASETGGKNFPVRRNL